MLTKVREPRFRELAEIVPAPNQEVHKERSNIVCTNGILRVFAQKRDFESPISIVSYICPTPVHSTCDKILSEKYTPDPLRLGSRNNPLEAKASTGSQKTIWLDVRLV